MKLNYVHVVVIPEPFIAR